MSKQKGFLDIEVGDIVIVADEYSHDIDHHRIKVESIEYDDEYINGEYNPKGMRCYGTDLDYWNEKEQDYDTDDYITVVTEGNFVAFEEKPMKYRKEVYDAMREVYKEFLNNKNDRADIRNVLRRREK